MNNSEILQPKESDRSHYFFDGVNGLELHNKWYRIMKKIRKINYELDRLKEFKCIGADKRRKSKYKRLSTSIEKYLKELENINSQETPKNDSQKLKKIMRQAIITTIREFTWDEKDITS